MLQRSSARTNSTRVMSLLMLVIGIVVLARTIAGAGGAGATGIVLGLLFIAAGAGRLCLSLWG